MDVKGAVQALKAGSVEYRLDRYAIIHVIIGKASFSAEQLAENAKALLDAVIKAKPSAAKGKYMRSVAMSATMSPGIRIDMGSEG